MLRTLLSVLAILIVAYFAYNYGKRKGKECKCSEPESEKPIADGATAGTVTDTPPPAGSAPGGWLGALGFA